VGTRAADETCGTDEVELDRGCEVVRPGKPVSPERAEHVAFVAIDEDPAAGTLDGHCAYQGIAAGRVDLYVCAMEYVNTSITFRMENPRGTRTFRWKVLSAPGAREPTWHPVKGDSDTCEFDPDRGPPCPY
jgi:hypothetical protein